LTVVAFADLAAGGGEHMQNARSPVAPVIDKVIHISVLVAAPPAKAFAYFTNSTLLQQWLTAAADVEERVGGKYELFWQPDDRQNNSTIGCRVTAFVPGHLVAFQWRSPKQFKSFANAADPLTHVVVTFVPQGSGARIHLIHSGWRSSAEWEEARAWQEKAWTGAFEALKRVAKE
jgi:uncharacterized protein YndB with AHSA1/START domain